jgi:ribosomal protein L37AE/L43A
MVNNYIYFHYKKYVLDETYTVPEPYVAQVKAIIRYMKKHSDRRESAYKRLGVSERILRKMITFWNNNKNESPEVKVNTAVRQRKSCPHCDAISIVRRKSSDWRCERCGERFKTPAQREYESHFTHLPPILQNILENKEKITNDCKNGN